MKSLNVGLIGLGTVGGQVARRLLTRPEKLRRSAGAELSLCRVLVRDPDKKRAVTVPHELLTTDPSELLDDRDIDVVVELAGGEEPARTFIERAIKNRKHVVTANKVVMARHGPELLELAAEMNVDIHFEAAVGGGIPLISTFKVDLQANEIERVAAVINGTTNYVLCRMSQAGLPLAAAVAEAQEAGYAEADPSEDVDGHDAVAKLAIMASIAFGARVKPADVYREGIRGIEPVDFRSARELGYEIKLLAYAARQNGRLEVRVHPAMVPLSHQLAQVEGAMNAVYIEGDLVGSVLLVGQGAGGAREHIERDSEGGLRGRGLGRIRRDHSPGARRRAGADAAADRRGRRSPPGLHVSPGPVMGVIARYRERLPVSDTTPMVDLREGSTPLVRSRNIGPALGLKQLYFKYEGLNPTGSFKDRGMAVAVAKAIEESARVLVCASTGNTSASAAAYAA